VLVEACDPNFSDVCKRLNTPENYRNWILYYDPDLQESSSLHLKNRNKITFLPYRVENMVCRKHMKDDSKSLEHAILQK